MTLDETGKNAQHTPPEGTPAQSPGEKPGTTQEKPSETFTRAEHEKAIRSLKAEHGRQLKELNTNLNQKTAELESTKTELQNVGENLKTVESRLEELERQGIGDNPEAVKLYQKKRDLEDRERKLKSDRSQLEQEKLEHAEELKTARQYQFENTLFEIAHRYNIESNVLEELNLTTPEQLEAAAKAIANAKGTPGQGVELPPGGGPTSELTPDSAKGGGGEGALSVEEADKLTMEQYAARRKKQDPTLL